MADVARVQVRLEPADHDRRFRIISPAGEVVQTLTCKPDAIGIVIPPEYTAEEITESGGPPIPFVPADPEVCTCVDPWSNCPTHG